jgi:hypothetical protein
VLIVTVSRPRARCIEGLAFLASGDLEGLKEYIKRESPSE